MLLMLLRCVKLIKTRGVMLEGNMVIAVEYLLGCVIQKQIGGLLLVD